MFSYLRYGLAITEYRPNGLSGGGFSVRAIYICLLLRV